MTLAAFVGSPQVGKTAIVRYLQGLDFEDDYQPTAEVE